MTILDIFFANFLAPKVKSENPLRDAISITISSMLLKFVAYLPNPVLFGQRPRQGLMLQAWLVGPKAWLAGPQEWLDGPEGGNGQMDRWTNGLKISPFYRTLSPIVATALPPPMKIKEKVEQGKGTADHLTPLGYLLLGNATSAS